ncbi:MAG TPA: dihydrofolate reductase family protein [Pyrinomonadaceae bacterium]|nr:dihydrofolate reductase family protein [Pyrinomonadaceae bacterium]
MKERKIIAHIATSADGYIARADGGIDWLNRPRTAGDYGMTDFFKSIDTVLWGRKTYDIAVGFGQKGGGMGKKIKSYVFTHNPRPAEDSQVEFVNEPIKEFATRLRAQPGKDIWMMGGGGIIASFLEAGEMDEFVIHVIPTFIGEGIPLIAPRYFNVELKLIQASNYADGVVRLHYAVSKEQKVLKKAKNAKKARK